MIVASGNDARLVRGQPTVYLEHGAGQTYGAGEFGYAGARGLDQVRLFLCPNEHVAAKWRSAYPQAAVHSVGCPALDRVSVGMALHARQQRTVAITFHWECGVAPEARSAFMHYRNELGTIVEQLNRSGFTVIGHGHPRIWRRLEQFWSGLGVEPVKDWDDVIDRAGILVADNTSAMYEWAAIGRPVVVLNAPWYRRDVEHGLRFWSHVPGRMVDEPGDVVDAVVTAQHDLSSRLLRVAAARYAYAPGRPAAARAADAIQEALMSATQRIVQSESRSPIDELATRLVQLGATDDEVAEFKRSWVDDEWNPGEREQMIGMADAQLVEAIVDTRTENDFHSQTPDEAAALEAEQARALELEALKVEAYEQIGGKVADVVGWVGGDPDRAEAVLLWEQQSETPRKGVLEPLSELLSASVRELDAEGAATVSDAQSG